MRACVQELLISTAWDEDIGVVKAARDSVAAHLQVCACVGFQVRACEGAPFGSAAYAPTGPLHTRQRMLCPRSRSASFPGLRVCGTHCIPSLRWRWP